MSDGTEIRTCKYCGTTMQLLGFPEPWRTNHRCPKCFAIRKERGDWGPPLVDWIEGCVSEPKEPSK